MKNRLKTCHEIIGNKQIVRDSWIHEKVNRDLEDLYTFCNLKNYQHDFVPLILQSDCLVTVGEGGIINVWRQAETIQQNSPCKLLTKISNGKGRDRHHRTKPY